MKGEQERKNKIRIDAIDWFFQKNEVEKIDLKEKYFADRHIEYSKPWGFHFTFGQIEEMYLKESPELVGSSLLEHKNLMI